MSWQGLASRGDVAELSHQLAAATRPRPRSACSTRTTDAETMPATLLRSIAPWRTEVARLGQFGGFAKLGSGSRQAANLVSSSALVPIAPYASSGVRPFSPECGRRLLRPGLERVEVDALILEAAPQAFNEHIVHPTAATVHGNASTRRDQHLGEPG